MGIINILIILHYITRMLMFNKNFVGDFYTDQECQKELPDYCKVLELFKDANYPFLLIFVPKFVDNNFKPKYVKKMEKEIEYLKGQISYLLNEIEIMKKQKKEKTQNKEEKDKFDKENRKNDEINENNSKIFESDDNEGKKKLMIQNEGY